MVNKTQEQFKSNNSYRANDRYSNRIQTQDEEREKEKIISYTDKDKYNDRKYYNEFLFDFLCWCLILFYPLVVPTILDSSSIKFYYR